MALHALVERYEARNSAVHRADARLKLIAALATIFAVTLTREGDALALALLALPTAAIVAAAKLPLLLVLRRSLIAAPFLLVAVPLLFTRPGETIATLPLLGWGISGEGLVAVLTILGKSWLSVVIAVVLTATTPQPDLLRALRTLRVPKLLVATVEFAYRYLFVVGAEASRMLQARASRSGALEGRRAGGGLRWRARVAGHLVGTLFVRSLERSERVHAAMRARGYDGEPRFLAAPPLHFAGVVVAAALVLYGYAVQIAVRL
ncbi:MAG: cobalt ECF transporter T component CbiQ [Chloroflexi bacterium]|nr:cobalt ECF transporter T component CbiQ [Chloroflexota bacterium]